MIELIEYDCEKRRKIIDRKTFADNSEEGQFWKTVLQDMEIE